MFCPMKFSSETLMESGGVRGKYAGVEGSQCEKSGCAWWDEYNGECAVKAIPRMIRDDSPS